MELVKLLAVEAQRPEFSPQSLHSKASHGGACLNPSTLEMETGGTLGLTG